MGWLKANELYVNHKVELVGSQPNLGKGLSPRLDETAPP